MRNSETKRFGGLKVMQDRTWSAARALPNLRAPKRDLEERLFYRRRASPFLHSQDPNRT